MYWSSTFYGPKYFINSYTYFAAILSICLLVKYWNLEGGRDKERGHAIGILQCTAVSGKKKKIKRRNNILSSRLNFWRCCTQNLARSQGHVISFNHKIWLLFQVSEFISRLDSYLCLKNARQGSKAGQKWLIARPGTTILQVHPLSNHQYHCLQEFMFTHTTTGKASGWGCVTAKMLVPQAGN